MPRIELTPPALLRPLIAADAPELHALVERNRSGLVRWMPWAADQTLAGTEEFIRRAADQELAGNGFQCALVDDGPIAGVAGFHGLDRANAATTIGYWLDADHRGRGLMSQAVRALLGHAFGVLELHRVELRVAPDNGPSQALAERLGFSAEGVAREAERFGREHRDLVVYSLLAGEWANGGSA